MLFKRYSFRIVFFQSFFSVPSKKSSPKSSCTSSSLPFIFVGPLRSDSLSMFRREVDLLRSLKHPSLWRETRVRIHDGRGKRGDIKVELDFGLTEVPPAFQGTLSVYGTFMSLGCVALENTWMII